MSKARNFLKALSGGKKPIAESGEVHFTPEGGDSHGASVLIIGDGALELAEILGIATDGTLVPIASGFASVYENGEDSRLAFFENEKDFEPWDEVFGDGMDDETDESAISESPRSKAKEFDGSVEATEHMEGIESDLNDPRLAAWAKITDSFHGTKSAGFLRNAISQYDSFMKEMYKADEGLVSEDGEVDEVPEASVENLVKLFKDSFKLTEKNPFSWTPNNYPPKFWLPLAGSDPKQYGVLVEKSNKSGSGLEVSVYFPDPDLTDEQGSPLREQSPEGEEFKADFIKFMSSTGADYGFGKPLFKGDMTDFDGHGFWLWRSNDL